MTSRCLACGPSLSHTLQPLAHIPCIQRANTHTHTHTHTFTPMKTPTVNTRKLALSHSERPRRSVGLRDARGADGSGETKHFKSAPVTVQRHVRGGFFGSILQTKNGCQGPPVTCLCAIETDMRVRPRLCRLYAAL